MYVKTNRRFSFKNKGVESVHSESSSPIVVPATVRHSWQVDPLYDGECKIHSEYIDDPRKCP